VELNKCRCYSAVALSNSYQNTFRWDKINRILYVEIKLLPGYMKKGSKLVMLKGNGFWNVKVLKNEMLDITFSMLVDPGGNIPAWMTNIFINTTPVSTMTELRKVMGDKKYQNKNFSFIH